MDKQQFLNTAEVQDFAKWLIDSEPTLNIHLKVRKSRFVLNGIDVHFNGIQNAVNHYMWKSQGMEMGDWAECTKLLQGIAQQLRTAIQYKRDDDALDCAHKILEWGGNRSWSNGAWPFLTGLSSISNYLINAEAQLNLGNADTNTLSSIQHMNSMLTKVHALASNDGLPIYDSRVSAAIATLVEMWRHNQGLAQEPLPEALTFPSVYGGRVVTDAFPNAISPGVLTGIKVQAADWASAKIRLGWLMQEVLHRTSWFSDGADNQNSTPTIEMRMHAFEASLFMIGYDVRCLVEGMPAATISTTKPLHISTPSSPSLPKSVPTLSGNGFPISYDGTASKGFNAQWGTYKFKISSGLINSIQAEFKGQTEIPLGASRTDPPAGSFGDWLNMQTSAHSGMASAIAAILVSEGLASKNVTHVGKAIFLDF